MGAKELRGWYATSAARTAAACDGQSQNHTGCHP